MWLSIENQKLENLLNLSLSLPESEREKSSQLEVGYTPSTSEWELIVKYSGDLSSLQETIPFTFIPLLNQYAIVYIREEFLNVFSNFPQIEYIEKPKNLFLSVENGLRASCIPPLQRPPTSLSGEGTLIAILDSGIDYTHPDFQHTDGTTRIVALWDQTISSLPTPAPSENSSQILESSPQNTANTISNSTNESTQSTLSPIPSLDNGNANLNSISNFSSIYPIGTFYSREDINRALATSTLAERRAIVPSTDLSGHGTHVAGIAAGSGITSGVAPKADLLIVKLGNTSEQGFPRTTQLMLGADFAVRYGIEHNLPVAINISFGNNYGSHDGTSLLETFLNDLSNLGKTTIVCGTGNEGIAGRHTSGILTSNSPQTIEFIIAPYETNLSLQLWKNYTDIFDIILTSPSNQTIGPLQRELGISSFRMQDTTVHVLFGEPAPYSPFQEIYFSFLPIYDYIDSGIWKLTLTPRKIVTGTFNLWLPDTGSTNQTTQFLNPNPLTSLTIPSTASNLISVGAYDSLTDRLAPFSGQGYTRIGDIKPDLVAPGVNISSSAPGGGTAIKSGTSMATPFVTGSAALLMEYGIVKKNDPYLYSQKVKAYLVAGARHLPFETVYPNPSIGFGALCLENSLPR